MSGHAHVSTSLWKPEVNLRYFSSGAVHPLFLRQGLSVGLELTKETQPETSRVTPASVFPVHIATLSFASSGG